MTQSKVITKRPIGEGWGGGMTNHLVGTGLKAQFCGTNCQIILLPYAFQK